MFGRFMPTDGKFFEIFNAHAKCIVDASHELELLIDNMDQMEVHKQNVQTNEKRADKLTHETIDLLHKTFITPLDRDEIHKLITTMDDILDLMEDRRHRHLALRCARIDRGNEPAVDGGRESRKSGDVQFDVMQ
ncbi:MAG: Phosphate transport regulator (distant homolog of PhoU) [uncultured Caballeronia sp.]|nr:MAG: Phosphate transport regulator (distant homolog of PhoU) [uncultured Caballeronia sp.]